MKEFKKTKVAVIMTVFNRKQETIRCLQHLFKAADFSKKWLDISVYMTDDGCTDNTPEAVKNTFGNREIRIIEGNGKLYWAGGMRAAWRPAVEAGQYDAFLLLNNDTYLFDDVFEEYRLANAWGEKQFNLPPICVGSTCEDQNRDYRTYGGFNEKTGITRAGIGFKECQAACANILFVPRRAVEKFGILHKWYIHGFADGDYTLWAVNHGWHNVLMRGFAGICSDDHRNYIENWLDDLCKMKLKDRFSEFKNPTRLAFHDNLVYQWRFTPWRLPICWFGGWLKCLCPKLYRVLKKK